MDVDIKITN